MAGSPHALPPTLVTHVIQVTLDNYTRQDYSYLTYYNQGAAMFFYITLNSRTFVLTLGKKYDYLHSLSAKELDAELDALV